MKNFTIRFWIVAILGYGRRHLNIDNGVLRCATESSYFLYSYLWYLIHQIVKVALGSYEVRFDTTALPKFLGFAIGPLVFKIGLCDLVVIRTDETIFLFGVKAKKASPWMIAP